MMTHTKRTVTLTLVLTALLAACREDDDRLVPAAVAMTDDALGYYCQMALTEHPGPKGQIHLEGLEQPLFFSQVRDAIAYQRMPEQSHRIAATYVSDMAVAPSWENPGVDNWILASEAHFVVGSDAVGGMGATEIVPFSDLAAAQVFATAKGGHVVALEGIMDADVLTPQPSPEAPAASGQDFIDRLHRLSHQENG